MRIFNFSLKRVASQRWSSAADASYTLAVMPRNVLFISLGITFFALTLREGTPVGLEQNFSFVVDTILITWALILCLYASWVTFRQIRQGGAVNRMRESQSMLTTFASAFHQAHAREQFTLVAVNVLKEYAAFFGADSLRIEIVEPRTGVTVDEFLAPNSPPPLSPEVKAHFLNSSQTTTKPVHDRLPRFLDLCSKRGDWFTRAQTCAVAAAITTPLGRTAIVLMKFEKPRRAFTSDEVDLLCSSLSGLVATAADHCKRKNREELERRLNHAERVQAVGTLAGGVAHEFNNILSALRGYGEMAQQHAQEGSHVDQYLKEMLTTVRRAEMIVSQILTLSRSREQEQRPLNLIEAMREALPLVSASLPELEVRAPLLPEGSCNVMGHPMDLQQVLINLCKNAAEAPLGKVKVDINVEVLCIHSVKSLTLGLLQPGKYVCLRVQDNGQGISGDALPRIFEPFFTTKATHGGTGLGLAAVHGLVTAMNGRINVSSEADKGTLFEIYFPHCDLPPTPISRFFETPRLSVGSGELIATLKVPCCNLAMHEERIAALGYEPVSFNDYLTFANWLRTERADLIIIDLAAIPVDVSVRDIENLSVGTPVLVTSRCSKDVAIQSNIAGHFSHLCEPVSTRAFAEAIRTAIEGRPEWQRAIALNTVSAAQTRA